MSSPDFVPKRQLITGITNAVNAVVTTTANHGYSSDEYVTLIVPESYGMHFDFVETKITVTGVTTFSCGLNTEKMDPFVAPGLAAFTPAHCCPASELMDNIAV